MPMEVHLKSVSALVLLLLLGSNQASAVVYIWKDAKGVAHYTNREDEIPVRYRAKAKILYPDQTDAAPGQQSGPAPSPVPIAPQPPAQAIQTAPALQQTIPRAVAPTPGTSQQPTSRREQRVRRATRIPGTIDE